ncbi:MAG: class I SAM-dependent methyltransferase [Bacteroidales bacterium]|nr:class I SAM-dependent methyltransferase [Bacteroidales bacterium]
MDFYDSISKYYDLIFPLNEKQVDFVLKQTGDDASSGLLLDIGCGTGNLGGALAKHFKQITAIDLDGEMLALARAKYNTSNLEFTEGSMLELESHYKAESFDVVCCFGNTLVHLQDERQIRDFIRQANDLLRPGGKLLIQIINYDRILDQNIDHLATIKNEGVRFERNYSYDKVNHKIMFNTILSKEGTDMRIENTIPLLPIRPAELNEILEIAGFKQIEMFGNFASAAFGKDSAPYVLSCVKD